LVNQTKVILQSKECSRPITFEKDDILTASDIFALFGLIKRLHSLARCTKLACETVVSSEYSAPLHMSCTIHVVAQQTAASSFRPVSGPGNATNASWLLHNFIRPRSKNGHKAKA